MQWLLQLELKASTQGSTGASPPFETLVTDEQLACLTNPTPIRPAAAGHGCIINVPTPHCVSLGENRKHPPTPTRPRPSLSSQPHGPSPPTGHSDTKPQLHCCYLLAHDSLLVSRRHLTALKAPLSIVVSHWLAWGTGGEGRGGWVWDGSRGQWSDPSAGLQTLLQCQGLPELSYPQWY